MRRFALILLLSAAVICYAAVTYTTITGSAVKDAGGNALNQGRIILTPTDGLGNPVGAMGVFSRPVTCLVAAGVITTQLNGQACRVADALASNPTLCYKITLRDTVHNSDIPTPGQMCAQPTSSTWSYDSFVPNLSPVAIIQSGPAGPAPSLAIGTVTTLSAGSSATASVGGSSPNYTLSFGIPQGIAGAGVNAGTIYSPAYYASGVSVGGVTPFNGIGYFSASAAPIAGTSHHLSVPANCIAGSASGTAYTCTTSPSFTAVTGDHIQFKADVANTASATLAVNGSAAATIKKWGGSGNLIANDLLAGHWVSATYDGSYWQLEGQLGNANSTQINGSSVPASATLIATDSSAHFTSISALPTSAEPAHTGDAQNTAGSLAMTVKGLYGTSIPTPTSGYLYYNGSALSWAAAGGSMTWPTFTGLAKYSGSSSWATPTYADAVALWTSCTTGYLKYDGTCSTPSGSMVYPGAGVPISTGSAWGTSLTAPASALVGLTDTQTLTNKTLASSSLTGLTTATGTTEQLRLAYDGSNYASFTTSSAGGLTIFPSSGVTTIKASSYFSFSVNPNAAQTLKLINGNAVAAGVGATLTFNGASNGAGSIGGFWTSSNYLDGSYMSISPRPMINGPAETMRLTNLGNVGIQTATPTANLQINQSTTGAGTVSTTATSTAVVGVGTQFQNTFKVGDTITVNGETRTIATITDNTHLTTDAWTNTNATLAYTLAGGTLFSVYGNGNVVSQGTITAPTLNATSGYQLAGAAVTVNRASMKFNWVGVLPNSQVFAQVLPDASEIYSVPANCTNSRAEASVAATASTTLTVYKCTAAGFTTCSSVGTIVFSAAGKTGAFTCSSSFTLTGSSSQSLYIQGPSTADATLANLSVALYATHN